MNALCTVSAALVQAQRVALPITLVRMQAVFGWDKAQQGELLSAFFLGYYSTQLPGGLLATRSSPSRVIGISVLMPSLLTMVMPSAALATPAWLFALRALQGAAQGPWSSCLASLWSTWSHPNERSRMDSMAPFGQYVGTLIFGSLAGLQCDSPEWPIFGGWHGVFHLHGVLGVLWAVLWLSTSADTPALDPRHPAAERDGIEHALRAEPETFQTLSTLTLK